MRLSALLILAVSLFELGCGSPNGQVQSTNDASMRLLGRLYGQYMSDNGGQAPADETQFVTYLERSADFLKSQGFTSPRDLLKSPRDGQALTILYGKQIIADDSSGFPWVAFESEGVDGKKYIIGARGNVDEVTLEQIEAMASR